MRQLDPTDPPRIGGYTLLGKLGAGGMGAVYLGRSAGGRTVAVKLVRAELADDPRFRARFRAEVAAARAASSAFTAPVIDADPDAPVPWMATAFVPGVPLDEAVKLAGPVPDAPLRALAVGIAEELKNIHAARLTHRDLKPSNVLLALDGPHVIDFGIARAADGTVLTAPGALFGTPAYMSPEQALGQEVTPASDVFSLGATLAFAASGEGPFGSGLPLEILQRVVAGEPDLAAVPDGLRVLVAACLAKAPGDRPTPQQVVDFVVQKAAPVWHGPWLPPVLVAVIEGVSAVMAPVPVSPTAVTEELYPRSPRIPLVAQTLEFPNPLRDPQTPPTARTVELPKPQQAPQTPQTARTVELPKPQQAPQTPPTARTVELPKPQQAPQTARTVELPKPPQTPPMPAHTAHQTIPLGRVQPQPPPERPAAADC
ncbi:protein kinase [Kitasatospora sp. NPDC048239]|uniref:serine/threonine-protein kinase n=1 Tax=Kitasatospora sp. NPDC048239 TaxID=3364046 RepID=UPI003718E910